MACAHPLTINPSHYFRGHTYYYSAEGVKVPCGYCVNCRRDYQNYVSDRAEYEYCKRLSAAFVTFTYDDLWLIDHCAVRDPAGGFVYDTDDKGNSVVRTSLNYNDVRKFLHTVRERVKYFYKTHPDVPVNVLMQPDFSYMYVGEYGDIFGRCHFHILFFGLDFAFCKRLFDDAWKFGLIDSLPLLDGGIRYVTKYMDKMDKGSLAHLKFDCRGIARPKLCMSTGFGQSLLWDNVEDILDNQFTYKSGHVRRPVSAYWKSLVTGNTVLRNPLKIAWNKLEPNYERYLKFRVMSNMKTYNLHHRMDITLPSAQEDFKLRCARVREENLKIQIRNSGNPVYDDFDYDVIRSRFGFTTYDGKKIRRLPTAKQRLLADMYRSNLELRWLDNKFKEVS